VVSRWLVIALLAGACRPSTPRAVVDPIVTFEHGALRLRIEPVRDDLVHFELTAAGKPLPATIEISPMIAHATPAIAWARRDATTFDTRELRVEVEAATLCVKVSDLALGFTLHRLCPDSAANAITISREGTQNLYGLGEQFQEPGKTDGDWLGRDRTPGNADGNAMVKFDGTGSESGSVGNAQFPILYALGAGKHGYALFVDDPYAETWSFRGDPWTLHTRGDALRWYVIAGPDLPDLRRDYMDLVGHAPVPPRQAFGLWISEYGFDSWAELEDKLTTLRAHHFPVDGFVMDLQWFGNIVEGSPTSRMGTLSWDTTHFPDPPRELKKLRDDQGIALMLIEESYVARDLPEHADLAARGFLARDGEHGPPTLLTAHPWWGIGGMIDWTNAAAADHWHDLKRQPLVDLGVLGHWCDLGEPEMYSPASWFAGGRELDIHDLYSLRWIESIARGYARHHVERRPFMMSRSGAPGIERYGASMWSGDIGSNLTTLAAHVRVQRDMSLSGIDYYGSDIGGFIRTVLRGDLGETYTQWFADGMAVDVPGRVHTWNTQNDHETAPDRVGHLPSNLASARRRYELVPYVYSAAHRALATGDPVFPPLVWEFQDDPEVRELASEKLIGDALLVALVAKDGARAIDVYLPRGTDWVGFDDGRRVAGGQWLRGVPLYDAAGVLHLPMFARAGAIVPMAYVDDATMNTLGKRSTPDRHDELRARVFAGTGEITLVEDDGETVGYQRGELRKTRIAQRSDAHSLTVTIDGAAGSYAGASPRRGVVIDVVGVQPKTVTLDGTPVPAVSVDGRVRIVGGEADVTKPRQLVLTW
jgi:alpha-glucosidase